MISNLEKTINNTLTSIEERKSFQGDLLEKYILLRLEKSFLSYQQQLQKDLNYLKNKDIIRLIKKL